MFFDHLKVVYDTLPVNEQTALLAGFAVAEIGLLTVTGTMIHPGITCASFLSFVLESQGGAASLMSACPGAYDSTCYRKYHMNHAAQEELQKQKVSRKLEPVVDQDVIVLMSHCNACLLHMIHLAVGKGVRHRNWPWQSLLLLLLQNAVVQNAVVQNAVVQDAVVQGGWHCNWQGLVVLVHGAIRYLTTTAAKQDRNALSTFAISCELMLPLLVVFFPVEISGRELAFQVLSINLG